MAEFAVNTTQLKNCSAQISALQRELGGVASRLGALQLNSVLRVRASAALVNRITDCRWAVEHQSGDLSSLARSLDEIAGLYNTYETRLTDPRTEAQPQPQGSAEGGSSSGGTDEGNFPDWFKTVLELMGVAGEECGPLLTLVGLLGLFDGTAEGYADGSKNIFAGLSNIFYEGFTFASDGAIQVKWADMFGFGPNGIGKFDWDAAFDDWLMKNKFGGKNTWTQNVGVACKWASYALSFVASGVQNYDEFDGDMGNARFWGETLIQGGVDIGLGALAGIAAAALLPATWPAIAVGAVGAGVVWAANGVCEWITGESIGEHVADFLCDGTEAIADFAQNVGDAVADGVETAWNNVCDWVDGWW